MLEVTGSVALAAVGPAVLRHCMGNSRKGLLHALGLLERGQGSQCRLAKQSLWLHQSLGGGTCTAPCQGTVLICLTWQRVSWFCLG